MRYPDGWNYLINPHHKKGKMKIEEAKALFMAQYLGQEVYCLDNTIQKWKMGYHDLDPTLGGYLLLRSVQGLTNEECIEIYAHYWNVPDRPDYLNPWIDNVRAVIGTMVNRIDIYQWLLRIGVLLDFTYLSDDNKPVTLSPATLISMGWARVK